MPLIYLWRNATERYHPDLLEIEESNVLIFAVLQQRLKSLSE